MLSYMIKEFYKDKVAKSGDWVNDMLVGITYPHKLKSREYCLSGGKRGSQNYSKQEELDA